MPDQNSPALLQVSRLFKSFPSRRGGEPIEVLRDVSFSLHAGESLGIVGESGSGKTTVAKIAAGIISATSGEIRFEGRTIDSKRLRADRRAIRYIYQEAVAALDPSMTIRRILEEPLKLYGLRSRTAPEAQLAELLGAVGLRPELLKRHPRELSGGQCQRIGIARALAGDPKILICDEPTSALDAATQRQVLELLQELKERRGISYLFITHNLAVAKFMTDSVMVMRRGRIVESGRTADVFADPRDAYTKALLAAMPRVDIPFFPVD